MKKLALFLFVSCVFTINSFAQKTVAYFDQAKTAVVDDRSVTFDVSISSVKSEQDKMALLSTIKKRKEVFSVVNSEIIDSKVNFTIKMAKPNFYLNCQNMLVALGVELVEGYGVSIPATEFAKTAQEMESSKPAGKQ